MNQITTAQIAYALRCTAACEQSGDCTACPYHAVEHLDKQQIEELGRDEWESCDIDKIATDAADRLEELERALKPTEDKKPDAPKKKHVDVGCCGYAPKSCLCRSCENAERCKEKSKGCCDITKDATVKWTKGGDQCQITACKNYKEKETRESK